MGTYGSRAEYEQELLDRAALPQGFRAAVTGIDFHPAELPGDLRYPMNLTLIEIPDGTDAAAGIFTRNAFPGAPVLLCRERIIGPRLKGILINNKVANVSAPGGLGSAEKVTKSLAGLSGTPENEWLYASTGVIGWKIPVQEIEAALPLLYDSLQSESILPAAKGIMTTDRYPKLHSRTVGGAKITAIAKGAGMIEPNMATMLAFILTDADIPGDTLQAALRRAAAVSFNSLSIDGDQSTSDMALILSSRKGPRVGSDEFGAALTEVCIALAQDIVRNGEGTSHLIELAVTGARNDTEAAGIAKAVINSPLVKTAVYGNDPNLGRLVAAIGDYAGNNNIPLQRERLSVRIGGREVFSEGEFRLEPASETALSGYLKQKSFSPELKGYPEHDGVVEIAIDLKSGSGASRVWGSDLSYEYIRENAEYRT